MFRFTKKLANLRDHLIPWAKTTFGNASDRILQCTTSLAVIQTTLDSEPSSSALLQAELYYRIQLTDLHRIEESRARQQSCIRWLREGDANTKFFHAFVNVRRARNTIRNLDNNGVILNDYLSILALFMDRFKHIYNQPQCSHRFPMDLLFAVISPEDNNSLCALPSMEELHGIIKRLNSNRVPGVDGFNGGFY